MTADTFMANEPTTKEDLTRLEENLGQMIAKGFDGVDKRFEQVDKRFERVEQRLERIEMKLENVVYRTEFYELKERLMVVEDALAINQKKK